MLEKPKKVYKGKRFNVLLEPHYTFKEHIGINLKFKFFHLVMNCD